jgi:hypothetical protein
MELKKLLLSRTSNDNQSGSRPGQGHIETSQVTQETNIAMWVTTDCHINDNICLLTLESVDGRNYSTGWKRSLKSLDLPCVRGQYSNLHSGSTSTRTRVRQ